MNLFLQYKIIYNISKNCLIFNQMLLKADYFFMGLNNKNTLFYLLLIYQSISDNSGKIITEVPILD